MRAVQEPVTLDDMLEAARNHPDEEQRIGLGEELLLRAGTAVASGLTALLLGMDSISGEDRLLSKDDRRELERILKCLSPNIGKGVEKLNNLQDSLSNPLDAQEEKPDAKPLQEALRCFRKGDHIAVDRELYSHHAIYDGHGGVVEYDDFIVRTASLEAFAQGAKIYRVEEVAAYAPDEIMERARSRMGEQEYHLLFNNCENFATWCRCG